jgi:hypothetical protein
MFLALTILNQSIDYDYLRVGLVEHQTSSSFDDIDSFSEYFIEKITDNDSYTSENDDDSGSSQNKETSKNIVFPDIITPPDKITIATFFIDIYIQIVWATGLDISDKISKGYFNISSPPPDLV